MRRSKEYHVLAILRVKELGLTQKEMADLAGCSRATIQAVELTELTLSESLALRISDATGVDSNWLLQNDLKAPPVAITGSRYTRDYYEQHEDNRRVPLDDDTIVRTPDYLLRAYVALRSIFASAGTEGEQSWRSAWSRLAGVLFELREKYGTALGDHKIDICPHLDPSLLSLIEHDVLAARQRCEKEQIRLPPPPSEHSFEKYKAFRRKHEFARKSKGQIKLPAKAEAPFGPPDWDEIIQSFAVINSEVSQKPSVRSKTKSSKRPKKRSAQSTKKSAARKS